MGDLEASANVGDLAQTLHLPPSRIGDGVPEHHQERRTQQLLNEVNRLFALAADGRRLVMVSWLDNLLKGAAGQGVQNMNLMCGWKEEEGLL